MSSYEDFAPLYDTLMEDAQYDKRIPYLLDIFRRYDRLPSLMLDLACGTGIITKGFADAGVEMIGVDRSADMLSFARARCPEALLLCQDARELELYGTVDGAVCCLDSINHLADYDSFKKAIDRVALFLEPGRLFVFDVNTVYKHDVILADNTFIKEYDDVFCVWQNATDSDHLTEIQLDFFTPCGKLWERSSENFREKGYSHEEICRAIESAGLELIDVLEDLSFQPPREDCQRAVYITKRIEK